MADRESYQRIWDVVRKIPRGRVATYGQVAAEAGYPKQPRLAGYAMFNIPPRLKLPWQRVINAQGRISFPPRSERWRAQKKLLEAEGVVFLRGRVNLEKFLWRPRSVAPVLD
ncbi:MAG TPA: MGMT family protein [Nevskiaceae bacterium]|nr:MGMT family protein [Nevskiaceae bacterium]